MTHCVIGGLELLQRELSTQPHFGRRDFLL